METETQSSVDRILRLCQLISINSEYLNFFQPCFTEEQQAERNTMEQIDQYLANEKAFLKNDNFAQLFIQLAYFLFSCRRYNAKPQIGKDDIRVSQSSIRLGQRTIKFFHLIIFYKINDEAQFNTLESINLLNEIYNYLFSKYDQYYTTLQGNRELTENDNKFKNQMLLFKQQYDYLTANAQLFQNNKEKEFFLCLEETKLFRVSSLLLKIKNSSILDQIKSSPENYKCFKHCKTQDVELITKYNKDKKSKPQNIKYIESQICQNIRNMFKFQIKKKEEGMETQVGKSDKELTDKLRILYKPKPKLLSDFYNNIKKIMPEFPDVQVRHSESQKDPSDYEYIIQYLSDRNYICVKLLINNIIVHIENSDFLMHQSNLLTFQTVNVNIELTEKILEGSSNEGPKRSMKKIAFKGTSCLNARQPPLEKILLLMDATMIAAKVCQPQLDPSKQYPTGMPQYQKLNLISKKIEHYTSIFLKCAKKVYGQIDTFN